ncbi:hypothetical protein [Brevundimonas sp.]|uniref:hypothetical protein n=1 Tax=Brevundimonas sp. TaxID=1871086 RepID=UPI002EDAC643
MDRRLPRPAGGAADPRDPGVRSLRRRPVIEIVGRPGWRWARQLAVGAILGGVRMRSTARR